MAVDLEILKFNLQERQYPYFSEEELKLLLEINDKDINKASYQGCLLKAVTDDKIEVSGIKLESNKQYWLKLADYFKSKNKFNELS